MNDKTILTIRETSRAFGFPELALRSLVREGRLPVVRVGNRAYIARSVFEEFLERGGTKFI